MRLSLLFILFTFQALMAFGQKVHTVKQGETLESIAKLYHVTIDEMMKVNESAEMLFPGLVLNIPQVQKKVESKSDRSKPESKTDKVRMRDGSYVLCKVIGVKKTMLNIQQDGIEGTISISVKEILEINYANGNKKKFNKR